VSSPLLSAELEGFELGLRRGDFLTKAQRTTLCDVIVASKDADWAYCALRDIPDLTESQRSALQKITRPA
jgi:hypothetical protein